MKKGGLIHWDAIADLRNVQDLLADGKTPYAIRRTKIKPNDSFWDNG